MVFFCLGYPTQWIEVNYGQPMQLSAIQMTVIQSPAGNTTHVVTVRLENGVHYARGWWKQCGNTDPPSTVVANLTGYTTQGQILVRGLVNEMLLVDVSFSVSFTAYHDVWTIQRASWTSQACQYIRLTTTVGPSYVAWNNIVINGETLFSSVCRLIDLLNDCYTVTQKYRGYFWSGIFVRISKDGGGSKLFLKECKVREPYIKGAENGSRQASFWRILTCTKCAVSKCSFSVRPNFLSKYFSKAWLLVQLPTGHWFSPTRKVAGAKHRSSGRLDLRKESCLAGIMPTQFLI